MIQFIPTEPPQLLIEREGNYSIVVTLEHDLSELYFELEARFSNLAGDAADNAGIDRLVRGGARESLPGQLEHHAPPARRYGHPVRVLDRDVGHLRRR